MNKLNYWRTKHGLSVQKLAKQSGVSSRNIEQIEAGAIKPNIAMLGKLAITLEVAVAELDETAQSGPPNFVEGTGKIEAPSQNQKVVAKPQGLAKPVGEGGPVVPPLPLAPTEGPIIAPLPLAQGQPIIKKLRNNKGAKSNGNP